MTLRMTQPARGSWQASLLVVLVLLGALLAVATPASAALTVRVVNTDGQGIASRYAPRLSATNGYGAPEGATVVTNCWTWGDSVGPYNNRLWWLITYAGRQFYAADRYLSTPNAANQPPAGEPQCGSTPPPSSSDTRVWVGAPFTGTWVPITSDCGGAVFPSSCSLPQVHHWLTYAPQGDWAVDLGATAGTAVNVYAAPQSSSLAVRAVVDRIAPACSSGDVRQGGYAVTVGFYNGSTRIGSASYAHITPSVSQGAEINRWGGTIGTVGSYYTNGCWDGSHLHLQLYSDRNYACFNKGWTPGMRVNPSNFLGFTGGNVASGPRQACA